MAASQGLTTLAPAQVGSFPGWIRCCADPASEGSLHVRLQHYARDRHRGRQRTACGHDYQLIRTPQNKTADGGKPPGHIRERHKADSVRFAYSWARSQSHPGSRLFKRRTGDSYTTQPSHNDVEQRPVDISPPGPAGALVSGQLPCKDLDRIPVRFERLPSLSSRGRACPGHLDCWCSVLKISGSPGQARRRR
jgi:hypothetical protein